MYAVIVRLTVRPNRLSRFRLAIRENAEASLRDEPGCLRFDILDVEGAENEFVLYELYRDRTAFTEGHRRTPHFLRWREAVAECVVENGQEIITGLPLEGIELVA